LQYLVVRSPTLKEATGNSSARESSSVVAQGASNLTDRDLPSENLQPFLDYLFTLDARPAEDEEHNIAHRFGLEPAHLKKLISRMRFD
jgi:hypothetical protein